MALFCCSYVPCKKKYTRKDNLDTHENEVHRGILKKCECGKELRSSSFSRHKKICPDWSSKNQLVVDQETPKNSAIDEVEEQGNSHVQPDSQADSRNDYFNEDIEEIVEHRVESVVKIIRMKDGRSALKQTILDIEGEEYILVPLSVYQKQLKEHDTDFLSETNTSERVSSLDMKEM